MRSQNQMELAGVMIFKITKTTKKNPNKAITRKKIWLKTYRRKADSLWKYTASDYRPTDIWQSEEKTINIQRSNNAQVKMMVVGRRITKGGKTNKMGSKTTGDAWNYYPNKTGSDNNRHQGNRERGKTWQEAFLISSTLYLLCPPNCDPGIILCTPQWRREEPCRRSFNRPHAHTGVFFEDVFLCMMHERAGAPRKYTNLTRRRNISLHSEVILTSLLPLLVGGIRWG